MQNSSCCQHFVTYVFNFNMHVTVKNIVSHIKMCTSEDEIVYNKSPQYMNGAATVSSYI
jgi:hypothetical protein